MESYRHSLQKLSHSQQEIKSSPSRIATFRKAPEHDERIAQLESDILALEVKMKTLTEESKQMRNYWK
jgi:hypothetical protein